MFLVLTIVLLVVAIALLVWTCVLTVFFSSQQKENRKETLLFFNPKLGTSSSDTSMDLLRLPNFVATKGEFKDHWHDIPPQHHFGQDCFIPCPTPTIVPETKEDRALLFHNGYVKIDHNRVYILDRLLHRRLHPMVSKVYAIYMKRNNTDELTINVLYYVLSLNCFFVYNSEEGNTRFIVLDPDMIKSAGGAHYFTVEDDKYTLHNWVTNKVQPCPLEIKALDSTNIVLQHEAHACVLETDSRKVVLDFNKHAVYETKFEHVIAIWNDTKSVYLGAIRGELWLFGDAHRLLLRFEDKIEALHQNGVIQVGSRTFRIKDLHGIFSHPARNKFFNYKT